MNVTAVTFLDVVLERPEDEEAFLAWWDEAEALLTARAHLERTLFTVHRRGVYTVVLELAFAGSWKLVTGDRPWQEIQGRRPPAQVTVREARLFRRRGGVIDVTTGELVRWLHERDEGTRDFVLLDALSASKFADKHLPGAVSLPAETINEETAARVIGARDRQVVIYCGSYG